MAKIKHIWLDVRLFLFRLYAKHLAAKSEISNHPKQIWCSKCWLVTELSE